MCLLQAWYLSLFNPLVNAPNLCLQVTDQLQWWIIPANLFMGCPFAPLLLMTWVTTNASPVGWGAHCGDLQVHATWSPIERLLHIKNLELLAILKAFHAFVPVTAGMVVQVTTDNTTALYYVYKQGGMYSPPHYSWLFSFGIGTLITTSFHRLYTFPLRTMPGQII